MALTRYPADAGKMRRTFLALASLSVAAIAVYSATPAITFEKDIRPILKAHCFDCHGEGEKLKGGLDLRLRRLMLKGGDEGPAIVLGKPDKSLLINMVQSGDMPKRE